MADTRPPLIAGTVRGTGIALPPTIITNNDLADRLDTSDDWIRRRIGIVQRRVGGSTEELAVLAGREALEAAAVDPGDIDMLVLATTTPRRMMPPAAVGVQHVLGTGGGAFDLNGACAGFVYALGAAFGFLGGLARVALVIGADVMTSITDPDDRSTAVIFADGAGAIVLDAAGPGGLLSWDSGGDGSAAASLYCDAGGFIRMDGRDIYRRAVRAVTASCERAIAAAGLTASDIDLFIPHQANARIIEAVGARLGISAERTSVVLDRTGNTSAASIPIALDDASARGAATTGDIVLLAGFGAGMTWSTAVVRL